jgi:hypothetical protein
MADTFSSATFEYPMGSFYQDLASRIANLETLIGTGLGAVPDFSITQYKLADDAVTTRAVGDDALAYVLAQAKWRSIGIGEIYMVNTSLTGVDVPPISDPDVSFVELTAGLTTGVLFNAGKLGTETVTGSAPLLLASAVVTLAASPMVGQTIRLLNSEGRVLRPSTTPGTLQNDALQNITGQFDIRRTSAGGEQVVGTSGAIVFSGGNGQAATVQATGTDAAMRTIQFDASQVARTATETRMKNVGVKAYMRIQ